MAHTGSAGHVAHSVDLLDMWLTLWIFWTRGSLCGSVGYMNHSVDILDMWLILDLLDTWLMLWIYWTCGSHCGSVGNMAHAVALLNKLPMLQEIYLESSTFNTSCHQTENPRRPSFLKRGTGGDRELTAHAPCQVVIS